MRRDIQTLTTPSYTGAVRAPARESAKWRIRLEIEFALAAKWLKLGEAEDIAVGVLEPRDLRAARRGPDVEFILGIHVPLELYALRGESLHHRGDAGDFPAQHRERLRRQRLRNIGHAQHDPVRVEGRCEAVLADQSQA